MSQRAQAAGIAALLLTAALLLAASLAQHGMNARPGGGYGPGMMGGYGMMTPDYGYRGAQTLDFNAAQTMIHAGTQGASVDSATNTVTYSGSTITIDAIAVQPDKPDTTFEIAGLVDPTLHLPRNAIVIIRLINMDYGADMPHGLVVTSTPPPYPFMTMPMMGGATGGIPPLAARSATDVQAAQYQAGSARFRTTTAGTYYYLCQVPGHAQKGMYGKIIVD